MAQGTPAEQLTGRQIHVTGIVQGVGFRPFVYNLARQLALRGQVLNTGAGVEITLLGNESAIERFLHELAHNAPPLAQIDAIGVQPLSATEYTAASHIQDFSIAPSANQAADANTFVPVSPDVALCSACHAELLKPGDRRYRYPFINCTNCGPRYTIIRDVPYDRPATTMADFPLCSACRAEYENPGDRRFHAQPNACPICGPQLTFIEPQSTAKLGNADNQYNADNNVDNVEHVQGEAARQAAQQALATGKIVAIKGIGGFHLACDARHAAAVATLRQRKGRAHKPFALMAANLEVARHFVQISPAAQWHLQAPAAPIVLLPKQRDCALPESITPGNHRLGIMLPYTPLHHLLFLPSENVPQPPQLLVMTSGNLSEEPIAIDNAEALARLGALADAFLLHNRPIHIACDDSVLALCAAATDNPAAQSSSVPGSADSHTARTHQPIFIRRSRGYAPTPLPLPFTVPPLLATGGELKNTICVARAQRAFLSGHIGDLANLETLHAFEQAVRHMGSLFRIEPQAVVCDLHPGYLGTSWAEKYAQATNVPLRRVQHHHAHVAALMAEHQLPLDAKIIGVALDGTGYGPDETIWGGEFLVAGYANYRRIGRLRPMSLPGSDSAIRRPYRMVLAALWQSGMAWDERLPAVAACPPAERSVLRQQLERDFNCVPTSSMGRVFDVIAALTGVCTVATYEAQGAIELEALSAQYAQRTAHPRAASANENNENYPFDIRAQDDSNSMEAHPIDLGQSPQDHVQFEAAFEIDTQPMLRAIAHTVLAAVAEVKTPAPVLAPDEKTEIAWRTHQTIAAMIEAGCLEMRRRTGLNRVGLTGGVFQNATLLAATQQRLARAGFETLVHRHVPPNDGGLALGQVAVAGAQTLAR